MKIYVNDEPMSVFLYDDENSILQRYANRKKDTLPEYLRIEEKDFVLEKGEKLTVEDFREEFDSLTLRDLEDKQKIKELSKLYPNLEKKDMAIFVLLKKHDRVNWNKRITDKKILDDLSSLKKIDGKTFFNDREIIKLLKEYPDLNLKKIKNLDEEVKKQEEINRVLEKTKPVTCCGDFDLEEITVLYSLEVSESVSLEDIFDSINVSNKIPFIHLVNGEKNWYKVYQHLVPSRSWIHPVDPPTENGIYFKILNSSCSSGIECESYYSEGVWYEDNNVEISFGFNDDKSDKKIKSIFFESLGDRINYKLITEKQIKVKGYFSIDDLLFNKAVMADMIDNDDIFSYFLFFNEGSTEEKYRSAITKARFSFYYEPRHTWSKVSSLSITITPQISEESGKKWIDIRIRNAQNKNQVKAFQYVFSRLLAIYLKDYDKVISEYKKLIPNAKILFDKYVKKPKPVSEKINRKSGKRLVELKNIRPEIFRSGYASMCQPMSHQPYILEEDKVEKFKEEYGENKAMSFVDPTTGKEDWYACEPREPGEIKTHIYPGIRKNISKNPDYKSKVPYIPCCFSEDQYTKPGSHLRKKIMETKKSPEKVDESTEIGHVLAPNKPVPEGRFGQLPYYLTFIVKSSGYEDIEKGKQSTLPIFRYGVIESPDSFLHCLEKAFNPRYSSLTRKEKMESVREVRKELASMDFSITKQELFDYSESIMKENLLDNSYYIDPDTWFMLTEIKYDCNIFIYEVSEEDPYGSVSIPRFSQSYLSRDISEKKKSVFIVKYPTDKNYEYQCEILVKYTSGVKRKRRFKFSFSNENLINRAIQIFYDSNSVYIISPDGFSSYLPVQLSGELFQGVKSQYIDGNGKTRALIYENETCLMTSPLPPLNVPTTSDIISGTLENALKFIKEKGLGIVMQDGNESDGLIQGLWVESRRSKNSGLYYGYIPIKIEKTNLDIGYAPIFLNDPQRTDSDSELEKMHLARKIADFLKQYTLFQYSLDPKGFGENNFVVIPDHEYNIYSLNKKLVQDNPVMYENGKLIVRSKSTISRLIDFLSVQLINDHKEVMSYSKRTLIKNYYRTLSDFRKCPHQFIFINTISLDSWKNERRQNLIRNSVTTFTFPRSIEAYFYRNYNIDRKKLMLIQNVKEGKLERALGIADKWEKDRINSGYYYDKLIKPEEINYYVYTEDGNKEYFKGSIGGKIKKRKVNVMKYEDDSYAAFLFL